MKRISKFIRGARVTSVEQLTSLLGRGCWVFLNHKAYHPAFIGRMGLMSLSRYVEAGRIEQAIRRV